MQQVTLAGCTATPFGNYLKALGVLRLVANAQGFWDGDTFVLQSELDVEGLLNFYLHEYEPTPILAPWNAGSGFYDVLTPDHPISRMLGSTEPRFTQYRKAIAACQELPQVQRGKDSDDARRTAIVRHCRNWLSDAAVDWLDAVVGLTSDGRRTFPPVLGTGGNEGNQDYTENHLSRLVLLLISTNSNIPARELLSNSLLGTSTLGLQKGAAGQFDPSRAGGANQGQGIKVDPVTNPWDLVLTMEGAVTWAGGVHRRQGVASKSILSSPFTVWSSNVGYGSAAANERGRAEIWAPLWSRPVRYPELRYLLREGRASISGRPARDGLEFAEAACSLGVDRGIDRFTRFSLLERRGKGYYVALPAGTFKREHRSETDLIRELQQLLDKPIFPTAGDDARRALDAAIFQVLLTPGADRIRELMTALGRMLRRIATTSDVRLPNGQLPANRWLLACGFNQSVEVRIAAALASIYTCDVGAMSNNLARADKRFAWTGGTLADRLLSVLERRIQLATAKEVEGNPLGGSFELRPGDATLFAEGAVDDSIIEDLLFAFTSLNWSDFTRPEYERPAEVLPAYAVLKHLFLPGKLLTAEEPTVRADSQVLALLRAGNFQRAMDIGVHRLRVANLRPLSVSYLSGVDTRRLAASLLIPVRQGKELAAGIFHEKEEAAYV